MSFVFKSHDDILGDFRSRGKRNKQQTLKKKEPTKKILSISRKNKLIRNTIHNCLEIK